MPRARKLDDDNDDDSVAKPPRQCRCRRKPSCNANKHIRGATSKKRMTDIRTLRKVAFVGLDVHKKTIQICMIDVDGNQLITGRIPNTAEDVSASLGRIPKSAKLVMESSSVWKDLFFQLRNDMGFDVTLSNPYTTKLIAESKKKTDKVDAAVLADMLRGGYIMVCHVPSKERMASRDLVRYRRTLINARTDSKNFIHGILLQGRKILLGKPFTVQWKMEARKIKDYRINAELRRIDDTNGEIRKIDVKVREAAKNDKDAVLLQSIPGIGPYFGLTIAAEIDGVDRFVRPEKLCAYAGLVPSVRASGETVHYGRITKRGSAILRWAMVEVAMLHVRHAPDSDISAFYKRIAKKRGVGRARVAAASKLLRIIHRMLRERAEFETNYGQLKDSGGRIE